MTLNPDAYTTIDIDKRSDGVTIATLNRPEKLNAVNAAMHRELASLSVDANKDPEVRVLVLTGAGRAFCAGGDFSGSRDEPMGGHYLNRLNEARLIVDNWLDCEKPTICAVNGYALGLGATVALLSDVVYIGRSGVLGDTHVNMGIGAGDGGGVIWPMLVGPARAKYFLMTGEHIRAEQAKELGLVQDVCEDDELMSTAIALAERLSNGPLAAISASKVPINKWIKHVSNLVLPLSLSMEETTMSGPDAAEAQAAFREKRQPVYRR